MVGTADGLVSIRRREEDTAPVSKRKNKFIYRNVGDVLPSASLTRDTFISATNQVVVANTGKVSIKINCTIDSTQIDCIAFYLVTVLI